MQRWFLIVSFFICHTALGQIQTLNTCLQWFEKADKARVKSFFSGDDFKLLQEKDSLDLQVLHYSAENAVSGFQPNYYLFFNDSAVEFLSFEIYNQTEYKNLISQLKEQRFRSLGADVNGNYITTVYDNDRYLLCQDYEALENPVGKGQLAYYRYRIYRKYGKFDELNGEKTVLLSENGNSYIGIRENYKNGVLSGERTLYYSNGTIKRKENYQAGRLNGLVSDYDEAGKLTHSVTHSYHWKYGMEKWYDIQGKVIRSLQWQRDVQVGSDKFNIAGRTFTGPTYKNGKMEGLATVPVNMKWNGKYDETNTTIPEEVNWEHAANGNWYFAFETVMFVQGLKTGKAIGISAHSNDTAYIAYYKNGLLDSIFTSYQDGHSGFGYKNEPRFRTTFKNGLENGKRIFYVMSGSNKGEISSFETYAIGKLEGETIRYFRKEQDEISPPVDPGESPWGSHPDLYLVGEWFPEYHLLTYKNGILNGPFHFQTDSMNYDIGTNSDGLPDGMRRRAMVSGSQLIPKYDKKGVKTGMVYGGKYIKKTQNYDKGLKNGEWITEYVSDSIVVTENYQNNKKHGIFTKKIKGKLVEERSYVSGFLYEITEFTDKGFDKFTFVSNEVPDVLCFKYEMNIGEHYESYHFTAKTSNYPITDTILVLLINSTGDETETAPYLNGKFEISTPNFVKSGNNLNGEFIGLVTIEHKKAGVYEQLMYENGAITDYVYTLVSTNEAYSGTFISDENGNSISVKEGKRHGWYIEYDQNKNEISRTKYKTGIVKKTIGNTALPKV